MDRMMNAATVAQQLGISRRAVYDLADRGILPELRLMVVLNDAVDHFLKFHGLTQESARRATAWLSTRLEAKRDDRP